MHQKKVVSSDSEGIYFGLCSFHAVGHGPQKGINDISGLQPKLAVKKNTLLPTLPPRHLLFPLRANHYVAS